MARFFHYRYFWGVHFVCTCQIGHIDWTWRFIFTIFVILSLYIIYLSKIRVIQYRFHGFCCQRADKIYNWSSWTSH